jgi:hypothetical protein
MRLLVASLVLVHTLQVVVGPPVTANKKGEGDNKDEEHKGADWVCYFLSIDKNAKLTRNSNQI